jgi:hypothetical protein
MNFVALILLVQALWTTVESTTTSPVSSSIGSEFRVELLTVPVNGSSYGWNFSRPFSSPLSSSPVSMAISLHEYYLTLNNSKEFSYFVTANSPSGSNTTYAHFSISISLRANTASAKIKYLACPTSLLSPNFQIIYISKYVASWINNSPYSPSISSNISVSLNTTGNFKTPLWISSINGYKNSTNESIYVVASFDGVNMIQVQNPLSSLLFLYNVGVTMVFVNDWN